jgi:hypothetical protein
VGKLSRPLQADESKDESTFILNVRGIPSGGRRREDEYQNAVWYRIQVVICGSSVVGGWSRPTARREWAGSTELQYAQRFRVSEAESI